MKRKFIRTSHGGLHKPGCSQLKRLSGAVETVMLDPYPWIHVAKCCQKYGSIKSTRAYEWRYENEAE